MRAVPRRLAVRLILSLSALVVVFEGGAAYLNIRSHERQLHDTLVSGMDQLSRTITAATWHSMLADRRSDAYDVMETIAARQGVDRIRIFNKDGLVTYATDGTSDTQVDKQAEACFLCHAEAQPLVRVDVPSRVRLFEGADGHRRMGIITPVYNEAACSSAACHAHPSSQNVLGVLDITRDLSAVDRAVSSFQQRSILATIIEIALLCLFIVYMTRRLVGAPLRELVHATRAFGEMDLQHEVNVGASGDLAELEQSFNEMRQRLRAALEELNDLNQSLEEKVERRTRQLAEAQARLVESSRMASLGQLAASMVHEINNPVSGIQNLASLVRRIVGEGQIPPGREEEVTRYLEEIVAETSRVGAIVSGLLAFSRKATPQRRLIQLNDIVTRTATLLAHKLDMEGKTLSTELDEDLPEVPCDPGQVQQVVMNLVVNAAEASPTGAKVLVRTTRSPDEVVLMVRDWGAGIAPDAVARIYEPFFTTKDDGKGVGLGLAVAYGIVQAHGGHIDVETAVGAGTTFSVRLPLTPPEDGEAAGNGGQRT